MIFSEFLSKYTVQQWIRFFLEAKTIHELDSPFVYAFTRYIIEDDRNFYIFPLAKLFFQEAKSRKEAFYAVPPTSGQRLFRAVHHFRPDKALEIGTGDGLSTIYLATAMLSGDLFSIEPNSKQAAFAKKRVEQLGLPNVQITYASPEQAVPLLLTELEPIDFVFFHQTTPGKAIEDLFDLLLPGLSTQSVLVLSGIHQNPEKRATWEKLYKRSEVTLSIDLFELGFLFFDTAFHQKQDIKIISARWKPWRLGLFR